MDTVNIPSETVPAEMKACEQILKRAKELKKPEPVVAYWCSFSAAQKALKVPNRSSEGTKWLMTLLDALEEMKAVIGTNEAVTSEAAGAAYIENFALKVFMSADNDDRKGDTGKGTIRRFVVAGQFIEVLRCFENGMTEEMEQKLQYARWKAADGAKALREGRVPTSGPPASEEDEVDHEVNPFPSLPTSDPSAQGSARDDRGSFSSISRPAVQATSSSGSTPTDRSPTPPKKAKLPTIDTASARTPSRSQSSGSGAWSTVATPGLAEFEGGEKHFDLSGPSTASTARPITPTGPTSPADGEKKNVRFMGPDGAPLSPATTHITVESYDAPDAPPPSTFSPSPEKKSTVLPQPRRESASSSSRPDIGSTSRSRTDSSATLNGNTSAKPAPPSQSIPPPPPSSLASKPSAPPASNKLGLTSPAPSAPPQAAVAPPPAPVALTRKQVEQAQKHGKWAVSALDYDDFETARAELRKALALLGG